jgi:hypothetical protein
VRQSTAFKEEGYGPTRQLLYSIEHNIRRQRSDDFDDELEV